MGTHSKPRGRRSFGSAAGSAWFVLALVAGLYLPAIGRAEGSWLVMEVSTGDTNTTVAATIDHVIDRLRSRGIDVVDGRSASIEVERKHSHTPVRLQPEEIDKLDGALRTLADHLASENLPEARAALEAVEQLTPEARDYLNRQLARARRRFHTCLLAAHLFAKEGYDDDAFQQVRKCARDFPGFEPEEGPYLPDSIRAFFVRAREELASIRPATLHIDIEGGEGERCRARVNGIDKGPLPATVADVRADEVRVQVDCDKRVGRIYSDRIEAGDNVMRIDPRLDRALDTSNALALRYPDALTARDSRVMHALRLARAVGVEHVIQLVDGSLHRIEVGSQSEVGEVSLDGMSIDDAVDNLLDAAPVPTASGSGNGGQRFDLARPAPFGTLGWVSVGAAVVSGAVTVVAWRVREGAAADFNDESCLDDASPSTRADNCSNSLDTVHSAETAMLVSGIAAGVFVGVAAVLFVLDANQPTVATAARHCGAGPGDFGVACGFTF